MRHGWKTRMDERIYFEQKRYEREERQQMIQLFQQKVQQDLQLAIAQMEQDERLKEKDVH
jgi:hypothetical protein